MALREKLQGSIQRGAVAEFSAFSGFRERNKQMIKEEVEKFKNEIMQELQAILTEAVGSDGALALKGDKGYTPQKGLDYFTSQELKEIAESIRPVKGRDYFDGRDGSDAKPPAIPDIKSIVLKYLPKAKNLDVRKIASEIARALEGLQGNTRLDYNALKNTPGRPVYKQGKMGGGGMSDPRHESFAMNGSATSVALTRAVAASGNAIIVRYQGQTLDLTTHYTVSGSTVSLTFTPEAGTTISVTYWPG